MSDSADDFETMTVLLFDEAALARYRADGWELGEWKRTDAGVQCHLRRRKWWKVKF